MSKTLSHLNDTHRTLGDWYDDLNHTTFGHSLSLPISPPHLLTIDMITKSSGILGINCLQQLWVN